MVVFVLLMPTSYAFLLSGIMAFGYGTYGMSHFSIHHTRFRQPLARRWAANHLIHHYHPESNFGVTTPLWDILLGTRYVIPNHKRIEAWTILIHTTPYHRRFSDTFFHRMEFLIKYQNLYRVCGWNLLKQNMPEGTVHRK